MTWCVGGRQYSKTSKISEMKREILNLKNLLKLSRENVVFVDEGNLNFLISK